MSENSAGQGGLGLVDVEPGKPASDSTEEPPPVVDLVERGWLPRHRRGDAEAFPALLAVYRRPVYGYLVRSGVSQADRDDVFQSIFLKVHDGAANYDPSRPLRPWLFTIVANTVRNHFRGRVEPVLVVPANDPPDPPDPNPGPEQVAEARETLAWLEQALLALPPVQKEVLLLATVAGLRQEEVAQSLHMPLNTVKTHLRRARLVLAAGLDRRAAPAGREGDSHDRV